MLHRLFAASVFVALIGCAAPINLHTAASYDEAGIAAARRGNWDVARKAWARAVVNAELARAPERIQQRLNYDYGRASGVICDFEHGEAYLKKSLAMNERIQGPVHYPLIELALINFDQKKYSAAVPYFERVFPAVDKLNAASSDPIGYADLLDEYATALSGIGREKESKAVVARARELRASNPGKVSLRDRTPYGTQCRAEKKAP